ncbi:hypothetical protein HMI54_006805 [Coelomomyces lativittatus]|nr:hypothetical protein HMI54_006805 [Coelomomyces lativittatus]
MSISALNHLLSWTTVYAANQLNMYQLSPFQSHVLPLLVRPLVNYSEKIINKEKMPHFIVGVGGEGCGKCHAINTPLLMANGTLKLVQQVRLGDLLMGDDGSPRQVLSLAKGKDVLVKLQTLMLGKGAATKGPSYDLNLDHILCCQTRWYGQRLHPQSITLHRFHFLSCSWTSRSFTSLEAAYQYMDVMEPEFVVQVSVKHYLALPPYLQRQLMGYRKSIDTFFPGSTSSSSSSSPLLHHRPSQDMEEGLDPYVVGFYLASVSSASSSFSSPSFTSPPTPFVTSSSCLCTSLNGRFLSKVCTYLKVHGGWRRRRRRRRPRHISTFFSFENVKKTKLNKRKMKRKDEAVPSTLLVPTSFLTLLKKCGVVHHLLIPQFLKCHHRSIRLQVLAGLLDAQGQYLPRHHGFCLTLFHSRLVLDVLYLARSLGWVAYLLKKNIKKSNLTSVLKTKLGGRGGDRRGRRFPVDPKNMEMRTQKKGSWKDGKSMDVNVDLTLKLDEKESTMKFTGSHYFKAWDSSTCFSSSSDKHKRKKKDKKSKKEKRKKKK